MTTQEILIAAASDLQFVKLGFWQMRRSFESQVIIAAMERSKGDKNLASCELQLSRQLFNYHFAKIGKKRKTWPKWKLKNKPNAVQTAFRFPADPAQKKKTKGVSVDDLLAASERLERLKRGRR